MYQIKHNAVKCECLMQMARRINVLRDVTLYSLVRRYRRFGRTANFNFRMIETSSALNMQAA
jgi:hypothetical protein